MMTAVKVPTSPQQETTPTCPNSSTTWQAQPADELGLYWGDQVALKVWVFCFLLLGLMSIFDFLAGL
ncbi:MAG TPA: hypothetical protein VNK04_00365 [Gemmataceae bacterium]|nr:hypothetical protein [Gemmataceae bacterium]